MGNTTSRADCIHCHYELLEADADRKIQQARDAGADPMLVLQLEQGGDEIRRNAAMMAWLAANPVANPIPINHNRIKYAGKVR